MKKEILSILLILVFIPSISAVEITLSKSEYSSGETLQAEITGNFYSLYSGNIHIYEQGIPRLEPVISGLTKQNNKYYFYAVLPNKKGNFSLKIQNAKYTEGGKTKTDDIVKEFKISEPNQSILSVKPGFILTNKDFSIKVKSLYGASQLTANLESTNESKSLFLVEDVEKTLTFSIAGINQRETNLKINYYNIPVFLLIIPTNDSIDENETTETIGLVFEPSELTEKINENQDYFSTVTLKNSGDIDITNITLSSDIDAVINPSQIDLLEKNNSVTLNITILISNQTQENLTGKIVALANNQTFSLPVSLEITKGISPNYSTPSSKMSCYNEGVICDYDEECIGEIVSRLEGSCCIGECVQQEKSSYSWLVGVILLAIVIGAVAFVYIKSKRAQKPKSARELLREKSERFQDRMRNIERTDEVQGKLDTV